MNHTDGKERPRIKYVNRGQMLLRPVNVDALIPEEHPARAIWEFTGKQDLSRFYERIKAVEGRAGRAVYDPRLLISIWIYAYSVGIGSAREISRKCETEHAFQWLSGCQEINYHTISSFRVDNKDALDELFTNSLAILSAEGLISLERVGVDGTKIKAKASGDTYRREERIREYLKEAREQVKRLEDPLKEYPDLIKKKEAAKRRAVRERAEKLEKALKELDKIKTSSKKEKRVSITDPESRVMKHGEGGYAPSYNVEIATDEKAGIVVATDVRQEANDYSAAVPMAEEIREQTGEYPKEYVADKGFLTAEAVTEMEERGIDFISSVKDSDGQRQKEGQYKRRGVTKEYYSEAYEYKQSENIMICPEGKILTYESKEEKNGTTGYKYRARSADCDKCDSKARCCPGTKKGRAVMRKEINSVLKNFNKRMNEPKMKEIYKKRGPICEFTNACIKSKIKLRQFNISGRIKAGIEITWASLAHNIKRWISLRWLPELRLNKL
jgi:transposase